MAAARMFLKTQYATDGKQDARYHRNLRLRHTVLIRRRGLFTNIRSIHGTPSLLEIVLIFVNDVAFAAAIDNRLYNYGRSVYRL